jgi:hypothetical protein
MSLFSNADGAVFYSESDPTTTFTVTLSGLHGGTANHTMNAEAVDGQSQKVRVSNGFIWASVGVVMLAVVAGVLYKKQQKSDALDKSSEEVFGKEEVFYLDTPDITTRKQQRRVSANVTPPKAAQRGSVSEREEEPFKLLDLLRAERRYWMSSTTASTPTIEAAAPTAKPGWKWPYNQAKEWLSGSRLSTDSADPSSMLDEAAEVSSVVTLHGRPILSSPPSDPDVSEDEDVFADGFQDVSMDSDDEFPKLDGRAGEGDETDEACETPPPQKVLSSIAANRRYNNYTLPGAAFSDSPRVDVSSRVTVAQPNSPQAAGYIEVEATKVVSHHLTQRCSFCRRAAWCPLPLAFASL